MTKRLQTSARFAGALTGAALAILALAAWRVPGHDVGPGASVAVVARGAGGVHVGGPAVASADLKATGPRAALLQSLLVSAVSERRVRVAVRASAPDLDSILHLAVSVNGRRLWRGTLAGFRRRHGVTFRLRARSTRQLDVRFWIPTGVLTGFERHHETLLVEVAGAGATA